ncbi:MAG TPA: DUF2283 domain-containing protein [Desulfobacterales bacterium]|nr:DUF2283 domain-containing protein [Desulfobacterales bacterium]
MKIEYDPIRDLLYIYFGIPGKKVAETVTIAPGVHADFSTEGKLVGIEVIDASEVLGGKLEFGVELTPLCPAKAEEPGVSLP